MTFNIERQIARGVSDDGLPDPHDLQRAATAAWSAAAKQAAPAPSPMTVVVRIVNAEESRRLNSDWRGKDTATNVLAFPAGPTMIPHADEPPAAGDLVICADVVTREATEQGKPPDMHWAHMVVHGCLHLIGYDHIEDKDAVIMERIEGDAMQRLGFPDPYL